MFTPIICLQLFLIIFGKVQGLFQLPEISSKPKMSGSWFSIAIGVINNIMFTSAEVLKQVFSFLFGCLVFSQLPSLQLEDKIM